MQLVRTRGIGTCHALSWHTYLMVTGCTFFLMVHGCTVMLIVCGCTFCLMVGACTFLSDSVWLHINLYGLWSHFLSDSLWFHLPSLMACGCAFLQDGFTVVADPSPCRHIPAVALAYADIMQTYLRSQSQLPAWDKKVKQGFWRLFLVRIARHQTYLPVPSEAMEENGGGAEVQEGVAQSCSLQELPLKQWLVSLGGAQIQDCAVDVSQVSVDLGSRSLRVLGCWNDTEQHTGQWSAAEW